MHGKGKMGKVEAQAMDLSVAVHKGIDRAKAQFIPLSKQLQEVAQSRLRLVKNS